jgi:hypothetical protein
MRWSLLCVLFAAPLSMASMMYPPAYYLLLAFAYVSGIFSWARARLARAYGDPTEPVPGARLLLLLHALALLQLVPLPPLLLAIVSRGSYAKYGRPPLLSLWPWHPITVWPRGTAQAILYMGALSLIYATVFRDFREPSWRRRLAATLVLAGVVLSIVGLVQAASADPHKMYGLWKPPIDWAVFGPYENRIHFAGYLVMMIPVATAFGIAAAQATARAWRRRRRAAWLALLDGRGPEAVRWMVVAFVLLVGVLATQTRGALAAFAVACLVLTIALRRREWVLLGAVGIAALGFWLVQGQTLNYGGPLVMDSRLPVRPLIWRDAVRLLPDFPWFGVGLGAFPAIYWHHQTVLHLYFIPWVHNEYLQGVLELGLAGAVPMALLIAAFFRRGLAAARADTLAAGLFGGVLVGAIHNVVDFNWHIPANAAAFAALAGLAVQPPPAESRALS